MLEHVLLYSHSRKELHLKLNLNLVYSCFQFRRERAKLHTLDTDWQYLSIGLHSFPSVLHDIVGHVERSLAGAYSQHQLICSQHSIPQLQGEEVSREVRKDAIICRVMKGCG